MTVLGASPLRPGPQRGDDRHGGPSARPMELPFWLIGRPFELSPEEVDQLVEHVKELS